MGGLSEVVYSGFRLSRRGGRVAYIVVGANIFFSGLTPQGESRSTINDAEAVIKAICKAEGLNWQDCQFYDIQTHQGYMKSSGEYCVDRLRVVGDPDTPNVVTWQPIEPEEVPHEVLGLFEHLIW